MDARAGNLEEHDAKGHRGRLRERLLDGGPQGFHDYELIEYLLTLTIPRVDTKPLAKRLLHDFGGIGFCGGLTTFSALIVQSVDRGGRLGTAYLASTVAASLAACWLGFVLGS